MVTLHFLVESVLCARRCANTVKVCLYSVCVELLFQYGGQIINEIVTNCDRSEQNKESVGKEERGNGYLVGNKQSLPTFTPKKVNYWEYGWQQRSYGQRRAAPKVQ